MFESLGDIRERFEKWLAAQALAPMSTEQKERLFMQELGRGFARAHQPVEEGDLESPVLWHPGAEILLAKTDHTENTTWLRLMGQVDADMRIGLLDQRLKDEPLEAIVQSYLSSINPVQ